jgi:hypothetical protein
MSIRSLAVVAVVLVLADGARAGEMDSDRPGAAPATIAAPPIPFSAPAQSSELDRESPTPSCFFFRPWWGWYRPWGFYNSFGLGFNFYYTYSYLYRPFFFPAFAWSYYPWWGYGFDPSLIWY